MLLYKMAGAVKFESWVYVCYRGALTQLRAAGQPVHAV